MVGVSIISISIAWSQHIMDKELRFKSRSNNYSGAIFTPKDLIYTEFHPLQNDFIPKEDSKKGKSAKTQNTRKVTNISFDPLSMDPLSMDKEEPQQVTKKKTFEDKYEGDWKKCRRETMSNFTSDSNLPLISILPGENSPRHGAVQEWLADLETRHGEMVSCWARGDRVEALKIIIQCLKSLSDSCAVQFYPAKVFHVLDVLSSFVSLVEKRLEEMDPASAAEVAKNWFYKIYSIRCVRFYFVTIVCIHL